MYDGNLAYKEKIKPRGKSYDIKHTIEKRLSKEKKAEFIKLSIVIIFFILGSMSILLRNTQVAETTKRVTRLKAEYTAICAENQKKEVEITKKIDLKSIEEIAVSSYNMNRARKEQIVHINVKGQDYGVVASNKKETVPSKKLNVFAGIMAYFK